MQLTPEQIQFLNAAERGDTATVRDLLAAGLDANTPDPRGLPKNRTALMHAAAGGHLDTVEFLVGSGASIDLKDKGFGVALPGGNTALLLALKNKHVRVAQKLLEAGANPSVQCNGLSALAQAAALGDASLIRQMLRKGVDADVRSSSRADSPLGNALYSRQPEAVRVLLSAGADPNRPVRARILPLQLAIEYGPIEAVQLLLHHGADPNLSIAGNPTPLVRAVQCAHPRTVKILLQRGADVNGRGPQGKTALDVAQQQLAVKFDDKFTTALTARCLDVPGYLAACQEIIRLLIASRARLSGQLPTQYESARNEAKRDSYRARTNTSNTYPTGIRHFLELASFVEPAFSVIAIRAPVQRVSEMLLALRKPGRLESDAPRLEPDGIHRARTNVIAVVRIRANRWTVILSAVFRLRRNEHQLAVDHARELSLRLRTKAIALVRDEEEQTFGYDLFIGGRPVERAHWIEGGSTCRFQSRFRRKPAKDEPAESFSDKIFRKLGIYLPACYPRTRGKTAWICVEPISQRRVLRADLLILRRATRRSARRTTRRIRS